MAAILLRVPGQPDRSFQASPAVSVLVAAQREGAPLRHDCGGKALCGTCRVRVVSGKASPADGRERERLSAVGAGPGMRLACQLRAGTDMVLEAELPPEPPRSDPRS